MQTRRVGLLALALAVIGGAAWALLRHTHGPANGQSESGAEATPAQSPALPDHHLPRLETGREDVARAAAGEVMAYLLAIQRGDWETVIPIDDAYEACCKEVRSRMLPPLPSGQERSCASCWEETRRRIRTAQTHGTYRGDHSRPYLFDKETMCIVPANMTGLDADPRPAFGLLYTLARPRAEFSLVEATWNSKTKEDWGFATRLMGMAWIRFEYTDPVLAPLLGATGYGGGDYRLRSCLLGVPITAYQDPSADQSGDITIGFVVNKFWGEDLLLMGGAQVRHGLTTTKVVFFEEE